MHKIALDLVAERLVKLNFKKRALDQAHVWALESLDHFRKHSDFGFGGEIDRTAGVRPETTLICEIGE